MRTSPQLGRGENIRLPKGIVIGPFERGADFGVCASVTFRASAVGHWPRRSRFGCFAFSSMTRINSNIHVAVSRSAASNRKVSTRRVGLVQNRFGFGSSSHWFCSGVVSFTPPPPLFVHPPPVVSFTLPLVQSVGAVISFPRSTGGTIGSRR